jgi:two-component system, NarL family, nitrate/nitrite response regulator NarL
MMASGITVAVVDDHPLFREGVIRSLGETDRFKVVGEGGSTADAIRISEEARPNVILIDLSMPGEGIHAIAPIKARNPDIRIVVLTVSEAAEDVALALNSGANGYVLKGVGARALVEILSAVADGETYVTPTLSARLLSHLSSEKHSPILTDPIHSLTVREREVLEFVATGLSNKEIAIRLDVNEKTIKHHMTAILSKLRANNRTAAAMKLRAASVRTAP